MDGNPWRGLAIGIARDLLIGVVIGILAAIIVGGAEAILIALAAIGGVIGGRLGKKWWGAVIGGILGDLSLYLLILVYMLLGGAQ